MEAFWRTNLKDIEQAMREIRLGKTETLCTSPGGRPVYLVRYGQPKPIRGLANASSALGAGDLSCYADKCGADYIPTVLLVGGVHGGEFEGIAGLLNLIWILETGTDYAGSAFPELKALAEQVNLLIIPCANPDGRVRVPFDSIFGMDFETFRHYNQGRWKDGTLCGWPDCKKVHPILGYVSYLGGYYNDNGVNLMHDNFFGNKAAETKAVLQITEQYAPDFSVLLHGGINCVNCILRPAYVPAKIKEQVTELESRLAERCEKEGLRFAVTSDDRGENNTPPASFNLISAMTHLCAAPCVTYESNQGLSYNEGSFTRDEIYKHHMLLFEEICRYVREQRASKPVLV